MPVFAHADSLKYSGGCSVRKQQDHISFCSFNSTLCFVCGRISQPSSSPPQTPICALKTFRFLKNWNLGLCIVLQPFGDVGSLHKSRFVFSAFCPMEGERDRIKLLSSVFKCSLQSHMKAKSQRPQSCKISLLLGHLDLIGPTSSAIYEYSHTWNV